MRRLLSPGSIVAALAVVVLLGLLTYGVIAKSPDHSIEAALAAGERPPAPTMELERLGSEGTGSLADYRGKKVVVLNYWASWCEPCREEAPALQAFHEQIRTRGGTVLGVDVKDVTPDALAFAEEFGLDYPMLRDPDGSSQREYGIEAYPETVVVDRDGRIAALQRGPVDRAWLDEHVLPLLEDGT
jgi:cytochrome c biogenesis protein CcmG/thiol:disulfide interchange protein DsbE